jgi:hypothetical protein
MKLAPATWEAGPMWLGPELAEPSTVPSSSTATTVRPGGVRIHIDRACSSVTSRGHEKVSPAATIVCTSGQIAGQSPGVASRIRMAPG